MGIERSCQIDEGCEIQVELWRTQIRHCFIANQALEVVHLSCLTFMVTPIQDKPWPVLSKLPCTYLGEAILAFLQGLGNCHQESRKNDATFMRLQPKVSCTAMRSKKDWSSSTRKATCPFTAEIAEIKRLENSLSKLPITAEKRWKKKEKEK